MKNYDKVRQLHDDVKIFSPSKHVPFRQCRAILVLMEEHSFEGRKLAHGERRFFL
jgi:hypothetical protein